jgi:hypothetical protein
LVRLDQGVLEGLDQVSRLSFGQGDADLLAVVVHDLKQDVPETVVPYGVVGSWEAVTLNVDVKHVR